MKTIRRFWNSACAYPLWLLLIGVVSYLLFLPRPGFYWDDWQAVYLYQTGDLSLVEEYFAFDRPFSDWTYEATFPVLGMSPWVWQVFTLLVRWAAILLLSAAFKRLWPERKRMLNWFGALLFVYPGFTLQPVSLAFSQHFLTFLLYALSVYLMVRAAETQRGAGWRLAAAVLLGTAQMFTMEYFLGLELLRPILLWLAVRKNTTQRRAALRKTLLFSLPFILALGVYLYWRLGIYPHQFSGEPPNDPELLADMLSKPWQGLVQLATLNLQDSIFLLLGSWMRMVDPESINLAAEATLASWAVGLAAAAGLSRAMPQESGEQKEDRFHPQSWMVGAAALLLGGMPVWILGRQVLEGKWSDRFALAPMIGAVLLVTAAVDWLLRSQKQKNVVLILLLGLSVALQMRTANKYNLDWAKQRNFYWQLVWRAPALKPYTAVFSNNIPSGTLSDYGTGFALNALYKPEPLNDHARYWFLTPGDLGGAFMKMEPGHAIHHQFRNITFDGTTSQALAVMYKPASGCLKVLDAAYLGDPAMRSGDEALIELTNPGVIDTQAKPNQPSRMIFGSEPAHNWCYFFQKADLARAQQDWMGVRSWMALAMANKLTPLSGVEYAPLLEAQFYQQDWEGYLQTSRSLLQVTPDATQFVCEQWQRLETANGFSAPESTRMRLYALANCQLTDR